MYSEVIRLEFLPRIENQRILERHLVETERHKIKAFKRTHPVTEPLVHYDGNRADPYTKLAIYPLLTVAMSEIKTRT